MKERVDSLDRYFNNVNRLNILSSVLFWFSLILSYIIFFINSENFLSYFMSILFVMLTVLHFIFSNILSLFLIRDAQNKRRNHLLSNSLGVSLDDEETNLYYNNSHFPSIIKLGLNVFENALFTWKVSTEMLKYERIKVMIYIIIWLALILIRDTDLTLINTVAQTIFATSLLTHWIKLEILSHSCQNIFERFRQLFLAYNFNTHERFEATVLSLVFQYETTLASMGLNLSSTIFHKINDSVSEEWIKIKRNLDIE